MLAFSTSVSSLMSIITPRGFAPRTPQHARSWGPSCPPPLAWLASLRSLASFFPPASFPLYLVSGHPLAWVASRRSLASFFPPASFPLYLVSGHPLAWLASLRSLASFFAPPPSRFTSSAATRSRGSLRCAPSRLSSRRHLPALLRQWPPARVARFAALPRVFLRAATFPLYFVSGHPLAWLASLRSLASFFAPPPSRFTSSVAARSRGSLRCAPSRLSSRRHLPALLRQWPPARVARFAALPRVFLRAASFPLYLVSGHPLARLASLRSLASFFAPPASRFTWSAATRSPGSLRCAPSRLSSRRQLPALLGQRPPARPARFAALPRVFLRAASFPLYLVSGHPLAWLASL